MPRIAVYISYVYDDERWFNADSLMPYLIREMEMAGADVWYDTNRLRSDDLSLERVEDVIDRANLVLVLLSQSYLDSDFIREYELPRILLRQQEDLIIIAVLVGPANWRSTQLIENRNVLPWEGRISLIELAEFPGQWEEARLEIAQAVKYEVERLRLRLDAEDNSCLVDTAPGVDNPSPTTTRAECRVSIPAADADAVQFELAPEKIHENVQFTVYRPRAVEPQKWYPLLAFAHLDELPDDAEVDAPDPLEEVRRQARSILGDTATDFRDSTHDSRFAVPDESEITFLPEVAGVEFNPPRRVFLWQESVHREEFRMRAAPALNGSTARGMLTVFLGSIILAEIAIAIRVQTGARSSADKEPGHRASVRPYRKIFASYSHRDHVIVEQFERLASAMGDTYLRDWTHLRSGEQWNDRLMDLIREADVFQLFWSWNSMRSEYVTREYQYAVTLNRPNFIRPTYWEEPLPESPGEGLPPDVLRALHFQRLSVGMVDPQDSDDLAGDRTPAPDVTETNAHVGAFPGPKSAMETYDTDTSDSSEFFTVSQNSFDSPCPGASPYEQGDSSHRAASASSPVCSSRGASRGGGASCFIRVLAGVILCVSAYFGVHFALDRSELAAPKPEIDSSGNPVTNANSEAAELGEASDDVVDGNPPAPSESLRLNFPEDTEIGVVYMRERDSGGIREWRELGIAKGVLDVPAGHEVLLTVNTSDLSLLSRMDGNSFDSIRIDNTGVTDEELIHLEHLTSLRFLYLNNAGVTDEGLKRITAALPDCTVVR